MTPLNRKLYRDLWRLRGQVLAIALVIASGIAVLAMSLTSMEALTETAVAYYERYRFGDVFASVERAPEYLADRVRRLPGVQAVDTRVVKSAVLDMDGFQEPVIGLLVTVPERAPPALNQLALRNGRVPRLGYPDEAVLSEPFAEAHNLTLGGTFRAVLNGNWRELTVVGIALSPEYVYTIGPGALMPDDKRFGIVWLGQEAMQAAFDLKGAFNTISVSLLRGTDPDLVIARLDEMLGRYGGIGAYARKDQISNWFLMNEIRQLESLAAILPTVFLVVAAFLTNMVLARLIAMERSEIGLLKAFGYRDRDIAWHYVKFVAGIAGVGIVIGWVAGYYFGLLNTRLYADFYRFPFLLFDPGPRAFLIAAGASLLAALAGTLGAVRAGVRIPPAEAMRPPLPPEFRRTLVGRSRLFRALDQPTRILLRQIGRYPVRSAFTALGTGMAVAVLVSSLQWLDSINHLVDVYFRQAQGQDITVGFANTRSSEVTRELARLPGVRTAEPMRVVPAKMRFGPREEREALQGLPADQELSHVHDAAGRYLHLPPDGLVISTQLAEMLQVRPGDSITVEVLEGRRPTLEVPVAATFETYIGSPAYMDIRALNRLMRERESVNSVHLRLDANQQARFYRELKLVPQVSAVTLKQAAVDTFYETLAQTLLIFIGFFVVFACTLAFGVTYNSARIALSERGRELATLRVLGFTRREISYILLGEVGLLTFIALPMGCVLGYGLGALLLSAFKTELYRIPMALQLDTLGKAVLIILAATSFSALLVRRRLDTLDLIAVLKTRE
ncbi:MAG: ABC transporter permease [Gammaproteobacteria bacterium]|nr:ABC transporter permease [Gammaproteobacteria bacterium]